MTRLTFAAVLLAAIVAASAPALAQRGADGTFERRTSSHFVLYQDVDIDRRSGWNGSVRFEREVLEVLEAGYDRMDQWLGLRPGRPVEVVVYDPLVFERTFGGVLPFPAAGFYHGSIRVRGATAMTAGLRRTLNHELVHAGFGAEAPNLLLPAWLNEGLAEWFAARMLGQRGLDGYQWGALRRAAEGGQLPSLAQISAPGFGRLAPQQVGIAYLYSWGLMDHVARTRGEAALGRISKEVVRRRQVDRAVRSVLRTGIAEVDADFREALGGR